MLRVLISVFYLVVTSSVFDFDVVLVLYSLADVPHFVKEAGFVLEFNVVRFFVFDELFYLRLVVLSTAAWMSLSMISDISSLTKALLSKRILHIANICCGDNL